jgi:quercetin dioxygenase-like cupin family protein
MAAGTRVQPTGGILLKKVKQRHKPEAIKSGIYKINLPLEPVQGKAWKPYPQFKGYCRDWTKLSCHVSTLGQDCCPHPPHKHEEEEILLLLQGEVDLILPEDQAARAEKTRRLTAGQFAYYPRLFAHTLKTVSNQPANYLMFKWSHSGPLNTPSLPFGIFSSEPLTLSSGLIDKGFHPIVAFEEKTEYFKKLHCHITRLHAGSGYDPHDDPYDVAIIVLQGEVETLGECCKPFDLIYYAAGEPHGMKNPSEEEARYLVFEFHGTDPGLIWRKIRDPKNWKKRIRRLVKRFGV